MFSIDTTCLENSLPSAVQDFYEKSTNWEKASFVFSSCIAARYLLEQEILKRSLGLTCFIYCLKLSIYDQNQKLRQSVANLESQLDIQKTSGKLGKVLEELGKKQDELETYNETARQHSEQIQNLQAEIQELEGIRNKLHTDVEKLNAEVDKLESIHAKQRKAVEDLGNVRSKLEQTVASLNENMGSRIEEMRDASRMLQEQNEATRNARAANEISNMMSRPPLRAKRRLEMQGAASDTGVVARRAFQANEAFLGSPLGFPQVGFPQVGFPQALRATPSPKDFDSTFSPIPAASNTSSPWTLYPTITAQSQTASESALSRP